MTVPDFQTMMLPLLKFAADGRQHTHTEAVDYLAKEFQLSDQDRNEQIKSGQLRYETRGGGYFLVRDYDSASDIADPDLAGQLRIHDRGVTPLKRKEALGWAESKALDSDKIEEMFGKVAEAGDQTGAILLRVPQTLKFAIEKSAAVAGVSTNTWLMRCAERAIASEREQKANP
jgi:restriction endonuclease Mrr